jgi:hypothetical protein
MKLVTFKNKDGIIKAGWLKDTGVVDMQLVSNGALPDNMLAFIDDNEKIFFDHQRTTFRRCRTKLFIR